MFLGPSLQWQQYQIVGFVVRPCVVADGGSLVDAVFGLSIVALPASRSPMLLHISARYHDDATSGEDPGKKSVKVPQVVAIKLELEIGTAAPL